MINAICELYDVPWKGVKYKDEEQTVLEVAKGNNLTPKEVWLVMQKAKPEEVSGAKLSFPDAPFPGFGKQTLEQICDVYHLDYKEIILAFEEKGFTVDVTQSVKDIANVNNSDPHTLFEIIYGVVHEK
jgi:hypothetical protein